MMVSLEAALSSKDRIGTNFPTVISGAGQSNVNKRKRDEAPEAHDDDPTELKLWCTHGSRPPPHDVELGKLDGSPLPPEWQRCLDLKSGEIHFYNTRTRRRTTSDPRRTARPPPPPRPALTLDLDLNLGCESPNAKKEEEAEERRRTPHEEKRGLERAGSPLSFTPAREVEFFRGDMLAAVCMRCHMLVMMCRSTPSCPNCKFLHPSTDGVAAAPAAKPGGRQIDVLERILEENNMWFK